MYPLQFLLPFCGVAAVFRRGRVMDGVMCHQRLPAPAATT